jgi:hypothetical protein
MFITALHEIHPSVGAEVCEEDLFGYRIMSGLNFM